ncbi:MAG: hypothetical protein AAGM38_05605 [Pseudomonadota bacterium]
MASLAALANAKPLTLERVERSLPVLTMDSCPNTLASPGVVCRLMIGNARLSIFAFSHAEGRPLVGMASYNLDQFELVPEQAAAPRRPQPQSRFFQEIK